MPSDGFCPKCGAVMYNGFCPSCGRGARMSGHKGVSGMGHLCEESQQSNSKYTAESNRASSASSEKKKSKIGFILVLVMIIGIAIPLILFWVLTSNVSNLSQSFYTISPEPEYYSDDVYIPQEADSYYVEIVSATTRGLSYEIAWVDNYVNPDDEKVDAGFSATYPMIIDSTASFVSEVNQTIRDQALSYQPNSLVADDYMYVDSYVTYMTEEILSIVFDVWGKQGDTHLYEAAALNFDMQTGALLTLEQMLPKHLNADDFREKCERQNDFSSSVVLESMTDGDIIDAVTNPETGVAFYSPVGVDIGFNYEDGWVTVTFKE